jgi:Macrocin-O-methyltransferase (TylF)
MLRKILKTVLRAKPHSLLDQMPADMRASIQSLIAELRDKNLTYVGPKKLQCLAWAANDVASRKIAGDYVEAGVALGGSAILIGKLKPQPAKLKLYDVFQQIPPPGEKDGADAHARFAEISSGKSEGLGGQQYYGYIEDLERVVRNNLLSYGITADQTHVEFNKGLFEDTVHLSDTVAFAHIDCDWYESVKVCIDRIYPHLAIGGLMVFDDYKSYSGCRRAVDEWLAADKSARIIHAEKSVVVKKLN